MFFLPMGLLVAASWAFLLPSTRAKYRKAGGFQKCVNKSKSLFPVPIIDHHSLIVNKK